MDRRHFITAALAAGSATTFARFVGAATSAEGHFEVTRTDAEWRAMLTDMQYAVMRKESTERAGSSPLDKNYEAGTYSCRGCDLPLYSSDTKFDSRTGWPSFWQAKDNAVGTKDDRSLFGVRTEVHCRRCGSHLGHIFDDGPAPTGKRHCLNGVSLKFAAA
ncbi:peptide-methionine (R)-S-oxide reductase MsrB [Roseovarius arcticus]|uniref:peptide-methionine (R)-S-oxide reductase MsrB n=1 Tax=Roseovarius arcticus TaxID=2547404 RepID=UPI0011109461|nr:peptide-methionine (R)-S-oxide reductase MsrB [Roseovarius arcticus]